MSDMQTPQDTSSYKLKTISITNSSIPVTVTVILTAILLTMFYFLQPFFSIPVIILIYIFT